MFPLKGILFGEPSEVKRDTVNRKKPVSAIVQSTLECPKGFSEKGIGIFWNEPPFTRPAPPFRAYGCNQCNGSRDFRPSSL